MHPKHTILLVEDEKEPAEMLANFLEMEDYEVLVAYDGKEAVNLIETRADVIDIAILDIMVPHIDRKENCKRIRRHLVL